MELEQLNFNEIKEGLEFIKKGIWRNKYYKILNIEQVYPNDPSQTEVTATLDDNSEIGIKEYQEDGTAWSDWNCSSKYAVPIFRLPIAEITYNIQEPPPPEVQASTETNTDDISLATATPVVGGKIKTRKHKKRKLRHSKSKRKLRHSKK